MSQNSAGGMRRYWGVGDFRAVYGSRERTGSGWRRSPPPRERGACVQGPEHWAWTPPPRLLQEDLRRSMSPEGRGQPQGLTVHHQTEKH